MCLQLFGFDPISALELARASADRFGAPIEADKHIGGWCELRSSSQALLKEIETLFYPKARLAQNPFEWAVDLLKKRGETITFAESCTGGLLAAKFVAVAGASEVFEGSLVAYSNRLKSAWLGVSEETLRFYGAVSAQCVSEMCHGALLRTNASYSLAISGIAGPDGGTAQKPLGTVFIGVLKAQDEPLVEHLCFNGSRNDVREAAVFNALRLLMDKLLQKA
jgi:nicotinamide-nucleotide amidase